MNETIRNYASLAGRLLLVAIFVMSVFGKITNPQGTQQYMAAMGMPMTGFFLVCAILFESAGTASLLIGYRTRLGTLLLIIFMIPTTLIFHTNFSDRVQVIMFMKNLSMIGGLLTVLAFGPGGFSLDARRETSGS
ncbi:MAG TPA: DoxX family protein [Nitrospiria bacterium]|nr:DoxX family protein [Nitrospiria bacterium]